MFRWPLLCLLTLLVAAPAGAIYRCQDANGVTFSDQPCAPDAERIEVPDNRIGGDFGSNLPPPQPEQPDAEDSEDSDAQSASSACRFINSTDLRRYLIRDQVVKGMTRENVLEAFGQPTETYPVPQQTWVYETDYYGKLYELTYVYFRDGCVERVEYRKP